MPTSELRFLDQRHWQALTLAGVERRGAETLAACLWSIGADAFRAGMASAGPAARRQFFVSAERAWQQASLRDPGMTDAWLGLQLLENILGPRQSSQSQNELGRALALTAARLGEEQRRFRSPFTLRYPLLFSAQFELSTPDDCLLHHASQLLQADQAEQALAWIALCEPQALRTLAALASVELRLRNFQAALPLCRRLALAESEELALEGLIGTGSCLTRLGELEQAEHPLQQVLARARRGDLRWAARNALAELYQARQDGVRELAELELLEDQDPGASAVAARLQELRGADPDAAWRAILGSLAGPLATDATIADNQPPSEPH